jgi:putative nucleotidyltransferase with HDIG domain
VTTPTSAQIGDRVKRIETVPAIPAVLLPLLELLKMPADQVSIDEVVRLVAHDKAIAAQCLRVARSALFARARPPESIQGAVISLGLRRVEDILLTCCLGQVLPANEWLLDPAAFWTHSLGCAMVCRKFAERIAAADAEKAYTVGLLHDIGFLANCLAFTKEFGPAVERATREQIPFDEAERATMGFTHCDTGRALAEQWNFPDDVIQVIAHHHTVKGSETAHSLVALVHLSDLLCRMCGLGYGYCEPRGVDLMDDAAWAILLKEYPSLDGVDLARFTFELDESVEGIRDVVSSAFSSAAMRS